MDTPVLICPTCGNILTPDEIFCPKCGTKVVNKIQHIGLGKQIWIYFVSLFLPPCGLMWTWKYFRSNDSQLKRIAILAAVLTGVGILITLWTIGGFFQGMQAQLNSYSNLGL